MGALWAEVLGIQDIGQFYYLRLRRALTALEAHLLASTSADSRSEPLRRDVLQELVRSQRRIESLQLGPTRRGAS